MTLKVKRGASLSLVCTREDENLAPVDVTTTTIEVSLWKDDKVATTMTVTKVPASTGVFIISLSPIQTQALKTDAYSFSIKYTYPSGDVDILDPVAITVEGR